MQVRPVHKGLWVLEVLLAPDYIKDKTEFLTLTNHNQSSYSMDSNTLIIIIHNPDPYYNNPLYNLDYNNGAVI
jgi:hypothetical protein